MYFAMYLLKIKRHFHVFNIVKKANGGLNTPPPTSPPTK